MNREVCEHGKFYRDDEFLKCGKCNQWMSFNRILGRSKPNYLRRIFFCLVLLNILVGLGLIRATVIDIAALKIADNLSHKQLTITRLTK